MYSKASQSSVNLRSVVPPYQYKAHPDTIFLAGNRVSQSQALQNHPFVHHNGTHLNHPCANSVSLDILKKQLPTDDNILPRLPLIQPAVGNMHLSHWDYSQIQSSSLIRNQYVLQQNPSITLPISSSQRNPLAGSSNIRGLMVSNIQPNLFPLLSHLSRFPIQSTNIESKQSISQLPPTISCLKQPTQLVPSTEKMSTDSESDPNRGSWMTEYEAIGVLLIQLRPLMVSNPYVQDYYFASQWLRRINAIQAKQITNGQVSTTNPPATMQLPIPIPLESLSDSNSPYQVTLKHKLVIPFSAVNLNPVLDQNVDENCDSFEKTAESQETLTSESSNALGRPTRSNVHRPRVVAELSLVSALSSVSEQSSTKPPHDELMNNQNESHVDDSFHIVSTDLVRVMTNRKRLLVLAQIERMYSLILILDEVSLSLKKVVVQNDARARLLDYQEELINQLISELFRLSFTTNKPTKEEIFKSIGENCLFTLSENLFSISKGMRLWCLTLHYLPTKIQTNYLSEFILDFLRLRQLWPTTMDKAATIFYPHLREIIYQLKCINDFLKLCFPDALKMNTDSHLTITDNLKSLLSCKLGLSLIFCLLDACARASNPTDPSDL
ncbi:hypothetical protein EWB00_004843 [Schistosoma japonicum]|uniref:Uncharacterized protein n=1 Tax=Schistosoma japonicum TaxID=6182 RepID=A0A4Z2D3V2_SCHJA|nr:hypothetical protein EWB00_004843 [Schistosoma japonicum]